MKKPVNLCSSTYCASSSAVSQPGCRFQDVASTWHTSHQVLTWGLSGSSCCSSRQASALPRWVCLCRRLGGGLGPMLLHTQAFSSPLQDSCPHSQHSGAPLTCSSKCFSLPGCLAAPRGQVDLSGEIAREKKGK